MADLKLVSSIAEEPEDSVHPHERTGNGNMLEKALRRFRWLSSSHGFDQVAMLDINSRKSGLVVPQIVLASFPPEFIQALDGAGELGFCSLFGRLTVSTVPFGWDVGVPVNVDDAVLPVSQFADEAFDEVLDSSGVGGGYCVPFHSPTGRRGVVIYFGSNPEGEKQYPALVLATMHLCEEFGYLFEPAADVTLSERQIEILQAIADGKRVHQVAAKIGLSEHTIHHYVELAMRMLKVNSPAQAVVKSVRMGIVS